MAGTTSHEAAFPKESRMTSHAPKYRKGSVFASASHFRRIDRNDRARILTQAEIIERTTKRPRCKNGAFGYAGLQVLKCLLFRFLNVATGRCDPSIAAIAAATGLAPSTVQKALDRIEASGILQRVKRLARVLITTPCPWTGRPLTAPRTLQTSNAYSFTFPTAPQAKPADLFTPRKAPKSTDTAKRAETNLIFNSMPDLLAGFTSDSLKASLMRLTEAITKKAATA